MRDPRTWAGVVGAKLGTSLYVDLTADQTDEAFNNGIRQLVREIQDRAGRQGAASQWASVRRRLEEAGKGSDASRALESRVVNALTVPSPRQGDFATR